MERRKRPTHSVSFNVPFNWSNDDYSSLQYLLNVHQEIQPQCNHVPIGSFGSFLLCLWSGCSLSRYQMVAWTIWVSAFLLALQRNSFYYFYFCYCDDLLDILKCALVFYQNQIFLLCIFILDFGGLYFRSNFPG